MSREDVAGALLMIAAGQYLNAAAAVHYALVGAIDTPRPLAPSLSMYTYPHACWCQHCSHFGVCLLYLQSQKPQRKSMRFLGHPN